MENKLHVFVIGSKGIPAQYGGFETFVDQLTNRKTDNNLQYHVSCLTKNKNEFQYNDARCFGVTVPNLGGATAVLYDIKSIIECIKYIKDNKLQNCIVYILACRIGPFIFKYKKALEKLNVKVFVNPDGNEWKRSKWNWFIRKYWKYSEKLMVKNADYLICDSVGIEDYINHTYQEFYPRTKYISYGADIIKSTLESDSAKYSEWLKKNQLEDKNYYLIVGRFVSENNYETVIREFMKSNTNKDLVIITNVKHDKFYRDLLSRTEFPKDKRIKFVGTVYDQDLLKKIREQAYGYIHGHEVGGTNPSLLEALASTKINILLDVNFNKEVGEKAAIYFTKEANSLKKMIEYSEVLPNEEIDAMHERAIEIIKTKYSWEYIVSEYEQFFREETIKAMTTDFVMKNRALTLEN